MGRGSRRRYPPLLNDPDLQDAAPRGYAGTDTVDWDDPVPGDLRVDYVLPSTHWQIGGHGVLWPAPDDPMADVVAMASRHRLVWVDVSY